MNSWRAMNLIIAGFNARSTLDAAFHGNSRLTLLYAVATMCGLYAGSRSSPPEPQ